ncbi:hypothetical protein CFP56_007497 [Quercus suber]|uniref:Uncharacterized protein n=1 Tax=Quercus suber TaxID=58331 RepID=A0AAW0L7D3_QUESU
MLDAAENQNAIIVNKEGTTIYWKSSVGLYTFLTRTEDQNDANFENAMLVMNFSGKIGYWTHSTIETWSLSAAEPSNNCKEEKIATWKEEAKARMIMKAAVNKQWEIGLSIKDIMTFISCMRGYRLLVDGRKELGDQRTNGFMVM